MKVMNQVLFFTFVLYSQSSLATPEASSNFGNEYYGFESRLRLEQIQTSPLEQQLAQERLRAEILRQQLLVERQRLANEQERIRINQTRENNQIYRLNYIGNTLFNFIRQSNRLR